MKNGIYSCLTKRKPTAQTWNVMLFVGCLSLTSAMVASFAPLTGAQKPTDSNRPTSKMAEAHAQRRHPSPRELMFSEDLDTERRLIEKQREAMARLRKTDRNIKLDETVGAQTASNQRQSTSAQNAPSNVRVTIRDIGPETGVSGSGSGFVFNRDTRQVILPTAQRVFRSLNGGSNWSPLDTDGSYFVRQDPRNPQVLYAVTANSYLLLRSNDFGDTWTQLGDWYLFNIADVAIHEASPNVVLVLRKTGMDGNEFDGPALWRSEDGGATFTPQWNSGLPQETYDWDTGEECFPYYSNIATTPADPNLVYVVQQSGDDIHCPRAIHKSNDGGLTFSRLEASPAGGPLQVFPHPTRPEVLFVQTINPRDSTIYRSMDGGVSFQLMAGGLTNQNFFVSFDRNNASSVYVAGRGGVFRSQDGGDTFQPLGLTAEQLGRGATNVTVDPSDSKVIYVNTFNGNFKSVNGGFTFRAINNGWRAAVIRHIAFDNSSEPNLYLATDSGIMRTHTRGNHFERVPHPSILNSASLLAVAPSNPNMIVAATTRSTLHRTLDGGRSWTQASVDTGPVLLGSLTSQMAVDPQNSNNVYFVLSSPFEPSGFYRSVDAGATFERTYSVDEGGGLAIDPIHTNIIFIGREGAGRPLRRSIDSGLSFAPVGPAVLQGAVYQTLIDPNNPNNMFIAGLFTLLGEDPFVLPHLLMRSTDGGATFSPADAGLIPNLSFVMDPQDPARLYSWSGPGLQMTTDSGNSWNSVPADQLGKVGGWGDWAMLINPKKPNLIYVLGSSLFEIEIHDD